MSQLSVHTESSDPAPLRRSVLEPNDSVGSDSFLLKVGVDDDDEIDDDDDDLEESEDSCTPPPTELAPPPSRRSKKRKTCHVMFGIFAGVVVVFVIIAISLALVFTLRDHGNISPLVKETCGTRVPNNQNNNTIPTENNTTDQRHGEINVILLDNAMDKSMNCSSGVAVRGDRVDGVYSFLGIRYAQPPVGQRRWKPSLPFSPSLDDCASSDVRLDPRQNLGQQNQELDGQLKQQLDEQQKQKLQVAEDLAVPICVQMIDGLIRGQEDCLYINIWTPRISPESPGLLNVIVYIHGGSLMTGSGLDIDSTLISGLVRERNVIVVTFNYRLNVFGFLSLDILSRFSDETGMTSGNYGYMDQVLALKWVQQYIQKFGGDPNKVTLVGQGSGATSIYALLASPSARGLFSRAWLASLSPRVDTTRQDAEQQNLDFLNVTACSQMTPPIQQYNCLIGMSATSIMKAVPWQRWFNEHFYKMPQVNEQSIALATVDGFVLSSSPIDAMKDKQFNDVPLLIGSTAQETDAHSTIEHQMAAWQYSDYLRQILTPFDYVNVRDVLELYPPPSLDGLEEGESARGVPESVDQAISTVVSDLREVCPTDEVAKVASNMTRFAVYRYIATYLPSRDSTARDNIDDEDLQRTENKNIDQNDDDKNMAKNLEDKQPKLSSQEIVDKNIETRTDLLGSLYNDDAILLDSNLISKEQPIMRKSMSHNYAYSGVDIDAFFGLDRRRQNTSSGEKFIAFSKLMRDVVFDFIETGRVKSWKPFPLASYDVSEVVRETEVRYKTDKCNYWRTNSFYPQYTWMN